MTTPEKVIEIIDSNIRMFEGYKKTEHVLNTLEQLRDAKAEVQDYMAGKIERSKMSWNALEWFQEMTPRDTYGT